MNCQLIYFYSVQILALALTKPGPTRSPKAVQGLSSNVNDIISNRPPADQSSQPIIIDLLPYSSASTVASTTKKYTDASTIRTTTPIATTRPPVVITAKPKTTTRPKTTTQAPGLGVSLWRALFGGGNLFETTTPATRNTRQKSIAPTTPKPTQAAKPTAFVSHIMPAISVKSQTARSVDISNIQVSSTKLLSDNINSASMSTPSSVSTTRQTLLNNPNPRVTDISTSTYSPEDDAKFLVALLRAIQPGK